MLAQTNKQFFTFKSLIQLKYFIVCSSNYCLLIALFSFFFFAKNLQEIFDILKEPDKWVFSGHMVLYLFVSACPIFKQLHGYLQVTKAVGILSK